MLLYLAAALLVCMTGSTSAQYYSNQPQRGYPAPLPQQQQQGQRNSEAWRRWYYQQRQQQQQSAYSSPRGRQPSPLSSPAANSQSSNYYNQRQPGGYAAPSSQQYYQQRPQPSAGYGQQQGYAQQQPPYNNYQQPMANYRPPPPPATPAPPTTPAAPPVEVEFEMEVPTTTTTSRPRPNYQWGQYKRQSAFGARSSADVLNNAVDLLLSAVQSNPMLARQSHITNRGSHAGTIISQANNFRLANIPANHINMLLQQAQPSHKLLALLGQKSGGNVGIGTSPGLSNAVRLLSRLGQGRTNPYSYPGDITSALRRAQNRASLQYAYSKRGMIPVNSGINPALPVRLAVSKSTPARAPAPTTTPAVPVATEPLEFEGPTTTPLPRFRQVAAVNLFQTRMAGRSGPAPVRPPVSVPVQQPAAASGLQPAAASGLQPAAASGLQPAAASGLQSVLEPMRPPNNQMLDYPSQPFQASNSHPPPGFISIDAFRADIMSAIQILTSEIEAMAASGSNSTSTTTPPPQKMSKEQQLELIKATKLAALPGGLSFLLGKFASKLPPKISSVSKLQRQVSQNSPSLTKPQPQSEWTGLFDLTPQQQQVFKKGNWSRQWPLLHQTPPPQLRPQHVSHATPPTPHNNQPALDPQVPPHQQHQPPQDPTLQSHGGPAGQNPPPEQNLGATTAGYPQQVNQSYLFEQQQPPPLDIHQQGPPHLSMQPHPLDLPGQQPWQQQQPSGYQQPLDIQGSQPSSYQQPAPQALAQPPPGPSWREPPPQQSPGPSWREPPPQQPPGPSWREPPQQQPPGPSWREPPPQQPPGPSWREPPQQQQQPSGPSWREPPQQQPPGPSWPEPPQQQQQQPSGPSWREPPQQQPTGPSWREPPPQQPPGPSWPEPPQQQQQPPGPSWREPPQQQPPGPSWSEPPPQQPTHGPPNFNSQSHHNQYQTAPQPLEMNYNPGPQQQQPPQPLDKPWQQQPGPQEYPHNQQQQQQQQQQPVDLQWSPQQQQQQQLQQQSPVHDFPHPSNNPPMFNSFEQHPQPNPGQNYASGGQYQPGPSNSYQQGQYQQPAPQSQSSGYSSSSSYYQPAPQQQASQGQQQPQQPQPQQQQYAQGAWSQQPQQSSYGAQSPSPAADPTDPFSTKFDMNSLKPTVFNSQYQNQPSPQGTSSQGGGEFAGIFGDQGATRQNPNAPPGKVDYGSKGPNPIQLNQFLAQPTSPKDTNALDALLGSLLSGTVAAQNGQQQASLRPIPNSTTQAPPAAPASSLVSDRLNGFVLGPKSEYRSNVFSEIPVNNAGYDSLNPLAGFMGETPPPPITTTPVPPGRNGDFLEGFMGVNKPIETPKPVRDNFQPNIYVYNPMNDASPPARSPQPPPPPPPPPGAINDQAINNMGTQDLSSLVQKLLGALAVKQGAGQG